jgi:hypothetical protein
VQSGRAKNISRDDTWSRFPLSIVDYLHIHLSRWRSLQLVDCLLKVVSSFTHPCLQAARIIRYSRTSNYSTAIWWVFLIWSFFIPINATFLQGIQWSLTLLPKSCICNTTNRNNLKSRELTSPRAFEFPFIAFAMQSMRSRGWSHSSINLLDAHHDHKFYSHVMGTTTITWTWTIPTTSTTTTVSPLRVFSFCFSIYFFINIYYYSYEITPPKPHSRPHPKLAQQPWLRWWHSTHSMMRNNSRWATGGCGRGSRAPNTCIFYAFFCTMLSIDVPFFYGCHITKVPHHNIEWGSRHVSAP